MKMERKKESRRLLAMLLTGALLLGCLSLQDVFAQETVPSGYGLSNPTTDSEGVVTWDCVYFGNYWQNDTNGDGTADRDDEKEPIKWRVLSVEGEDAFLMADKGLDCQKYNDTEEDITWEKCTLRSWLNGYGITENLCQKDFSSDNFIDNAFDDVERGAIKNTEVSNEDNLEYSIEGGEDSIDKVYLLSLNEIENAVYGFASDMERITQNTKYVKGLGAVNANGNSYWWLRTPGYGSQYAALVGFNGYVSRTGGSFKKRVYAVRPVLHLDLSAGDNMWKLAGKVTTTGEEIPPETPTPTKTPEVTEEPVKTLEPTQTPEVTEQPTGSPTVTQTASPTESPIVTEKPERTPEASLTPEPTSTQTPGVEPTPSPMATEKPVITPEPTIEPAPTRQPSPNPTGTPAPTKSPAPDQNLSDIIGGLGVSEETAVKIQKTAEELNVAKDTILVTEQTILSQKTDEDIKGSYFARIQARAPQITQKNIKLSWNKVKGADGYEIYGNRCNTKNWIYEYKRMKTITNPNKNSFIDRKCKKGTYYKYIVRAYKIIDGKKVTIAASKTIHVTTTGGKNGNAKSVKVNKKKVSLKTGNDLKLRAWEIKKDKPLRHHREVSFESSDPGVATISRKGRIKAKKKGNCTIYAYAQNGKYRKIKVKVK